VEITAVSIDVNDGAKSARTVPNCKTAHRPMAKGNHQLMAAASIIAN
jgi:hypothetical protein